RDGWGRIARSHRRSRRPRPAQRRSSSLSFHFLPGVLYTLAPRLRPGLGRHACTGKLHTDPPGPGVTTETFDSRAKPRPHDTHLAPARSIETRTSWIVASVSL